MSLKADGMVHCHYYLCGKWSWRQQDAKACPGCGSIYNAEGVMEDIGVQRRIVEENGKNLYNAGRDHFLKIEKMLAKLIRKRRRAKIMPWKKKPSRRSDSTAQRSRQAGKNSLRKASRISSTSGASSRKSRRTR